LLKDKSTYEPGFVAKKLIKEEIWRQVLSSLCICFFARGIYSHEVVIKALKCVGLEFTEKELDAIGEKIYREKFEFKKREGFEFDKLTIPKRITETKTPVGMIEEEFIRKTVDLVKSFHEKPQ
jgi:aldehyde:ferredoxin oxidoreductase